MNLLEKDEGWKRTSNINVLNNVEDIILVDLSLLLGFEHVIDRAF